MRNLVKRILRDARNRHFAVLLETENLNSKVVWNVVNDQGVGKSSKQIADPTVDLNELNSFFCGLNKPVDLDLLQYYRDQRGIFSNVNNVLNFNELDTEVIHNMILDISSNAVGNDGISIRFIKLIFQKIKFPCCTFLNIPCPMVSTRLNGKEH